MEIAYLPLFLNVTHTNYMLINYLVIVHVLYMSYKKLCDAETGITYAGNCLPFLRCAIQVQEKIELSHNKIAFLSVNKTIRSPVR